MILTFPFDRVIVAMEFLDIPTDAVDMKFSIPERGDPNYPKGYRPMQEMTARMTRDELRELIRTLERLI